LGKEKTRAVETPVPNQARKKPNERRRKWKAQISKEDDRGLRAKKKRGSANRIFRGRKVVVPLAMIPPYRKGGATDPKRPDSQ